MLLAVSCQVPKVPVATFISTLSVEAPKRLIDKDKPLVVYCHHGMRSAWAANWLRAMGYENVYNLTGGIDAWAERIEPGMARY